MDSCRRFCSISFTYKSLDAAVKKKKKPKQFSSSIKVNVSLQINICN